MATKPWERQSDESTQAYAAFELYLHLGKDRTVVEAYRQSQRKPDAKQADGTWNKWAKAHNWADRARQYDNQEVAAFQKGVEKERERAGRFWAEMRDRQLREDAERYAKRLKQSDLLAALPLTTQRLEKDGRTTIIEAADPEVHRKAIVIAKYAHEMLWDVIDRGMDLERTATEETAAQAMAPPPTTATLDLAPGRPSRLDEWRAWQRSQVIKIRRTDPRDDAGSGPPSNGTTAH